MFRVTFAPDPSDWSDLSDQSDADSPQTTNYAPTFADSKILVNFSPDFEIVLPSM